VERKILQSKFWQDVSFRSLLLCAAAVFCLFAPLGFLVDVLDAGRNTGPHLAFLVVLSGLMSVGYFLTGTRRRMWALCGLAVVQVAITYWSVRFFPAPRTPLDIASLRSRLILDGLGVITGIMASYSLFMAFIATEGIRQVKMRTELTLAGEIHDTLVPPIELRGSGFEVRGRAVPASSVGGDLVDAVVVGGTLIAYVADVSGHGVPAGTLMAGLKSAARMRLRAPASISALLDDLNAVLFDIKRPNMFATAACFRLAEDGNNATYALAGHLPVLHFRASTRAVDRWTTGQLALGILAGQTYDETAVTVRGGDTIALVTDGLTEVEDPRGRELGLEGIEAVLRARGDEPLDRLLEAILAAVRSHGPQRDDQTLLLVRIPLAPETRTPGARNVDPAGH
jgi:serine phosphatase RsbU (regulator of sigma subunit)